MKFFHALSISNKLLVILLPVLLLSFVLLGQITTRKIKASLREETVRQLNSTVTSPSDMVAIANKSIPRDADAKMNDLRQHYLGKFALEPGSRCGSAPWRPPCSASTAVNLADGVVDQCSQQNEDSVATVFVRSWQPSVPTLQERKRRLDIAGLLRSGPASRKGRLFHKAILR